jgi:ADP-ribosyl-[dinitrogen reductase] hydrolase
VSKQSSAITHYDPRCVYGCAVLNLTLAKLMNGADNPLQTALDHVQEEAPAELIEALRPVCRSTASQEITPETLSSSGYVVDTLQTALYHGLTAESAKEGIVAAINCGGDADTIGAVTGTVVGARFGKAELPDRWLQAITETPTLTRLSRSLLDDSFDISPESASYEYGATLPVTRNATHD